MKKTFSINKPSGDVLLTYYKGNVRIEAGLMRFAIESPKHVFRFVIQEPSEDEQKLRPRDVLELSPSRVLFRNGHEVSCPKFQLSKTEELPSDERTARSSELRLDKVQSIAKELADKKSGRGKNKKGDKTPDEKRWEREVFNHYKKEKLLKPSLSYKEFADETRSEYGLTTDEMRRLIGRVSKRKQRGTK